MLFAVFIYIIVAGSMGGTPYTAETHEVYKDARCGFQINTTSAWDASHNDTSCYVSFEKRGKAIIVQVFNNTYSLSEYMSSLGVDSDGIEENGYGIFDEQAHATMTVDGTKYYARFLMSHGQGRWYVVTYISQKSYDSESENDLLYSFRTI